MLACAGAALAQSDGVTVPQQLTLTSTNNLANQKNVLATNAFITFAPSGTNSIFIDASRQNFMAVEFDVSGGVATSNQTFYLVPSVVSGKFDSNQVKTITVAEPGVAGGIATVITNLTSSGIAGWYLAAASNASWTIHTTNIVNELIKTKAQ